MTAMDSDLTAFNREVDTSRRTSKGPSILYLWGKKERSDDRMLL